MKLGSKVTSVLTIYPQSDRLKKASVQNVIESMTSYPPESFFVAVSDGYIGTIQIISDDKQKLQVSQYSLWHEKSLSSHGRLHYTRP